ncbi:Os12g0242200 [Oryza sativa Japonica Group]|uniref:Os12g0242200 protein n=1 Tax=Oryza sativa subsp. japonica TaxID=39947 RepID=A0A0P0Y8I1_ORYSJ|nr:Os12g0242200 [Oryza sativa Japonica Group]
MYTPHSYARLLATVSAAAFVVGAFRSQSGERRRREDGVETYYRCTVLVAGVFAGASSLALLAAAVGIASYVALEAAAAAPCWEERRLGVAAAGQPEQGRRGHGCPSYGSNKTMLELFEDEAA